MPQPIDLRSRTNKNPLEMQSRTTKPSLKLYCTRICFCRFQIRYPLLISVVFVNTSKHTSRHVSLTFHFKSKMYWISRCGTLHWQFQLFLYMPTSLHNHVFVGYSSTLPLIKQSTVFDKPEYPKTIIVIKWKQPPYQ